MHNFIFNMKELRYAMESIGNLQVNTKEFVL
jgi:hypothetical protein